MSQIAVESLAAGQWSSILHEIALLSARLCLVSPKIPRNCSSSLSQKKNEIAINGRHRPTFSLSLSARASTFSSSSMVDSSIRMTQIYIRYVGGFRAPLSFEFFVRFVTGTGGSNQASTKQFDPVSLRRTDQRGKCEGKSLDRCRGSHRLLNGDG
jgi:hypothetical protein